MIIVGLPYKKVKLDIPKDAFWIDPESKDEYKNIKWVTFSPEVNLSNKYSIVGTKYYSKKVSNILAGISNYPIDYDLLFGTRDGKYNLMESPYHLGLKQKLSEKYSGTKELVLKKLYYSSFMWYHILDVLNRNPEWWVDLLELWHSENTYTLYDSRDKNSGLPMTKLKNNGVYGIPECIVMLCAGISFMQKEGV